MLAPRSGWGDLPRPFHFSPMRSSLFLALGLAACAPPDAVPALASPDTTESPPTTVTPYTPWDVEANPFPPECRADTLSLSQQRDCVADLIEEARAEVDGAYQALLDSAAAMPGTEEIKAEMRRTYEASQQAWMTFVVADCEAVEWAPLWRGGTISGDFAQACWLTHARARTAELRALVGTE